jgi:hypothetical protein
VNDSGVVDNGAAVITPKIEAAAAVNVTDDAVNEDADKPSL